LRILLVLIFLFVLVFAKKDFYYGFIDSSGNQISRKDLQAIKDGFEIIRHARKIAKEGKIEEAYAQIVDFKKKNKIDVLKSDLIILNAQLSLKKGSTRLILEATKELENAINASKIYENYLVIAYETMVELKLKTNKPNEAKYFANIIMKDFNSPTTKAYGKVFLAKVYKHQLEYEKATQILYKALTKATDLFIATFIANELFDVYILDGKRDKAYELISKVLKRNISYYVDDSFVAIENVNKLVRASMPNFAIEILKELLKRTKRLESIEKFKFKLANIYMLAPDKENKNLEKAKELYKELLSVYPKGIYTKKAKMYLDEILMRQGFVNPAILSNRYKNSQSMQQKILLQELLNDKVKQKYKAILKSKKAYEKISNSIAKRFGYKSMGAIFDEVNIDMIREYLKDGRCLLLGEVLETSRAKTLEALIQDKQLKHSFFKCLIRNPHEKAYDKLKKVFDKSRDANIYFYLERMALVLRKYSQAEDFSAKVAMVDDRDILSKEFLYRFLILNEKNNLIELEKYFSYAMKNKDYIKANEENPSIIDFYYSYYLFLIKKGFKEEAKDALQKLYDKQNQFKAHVYSPFVERELAIMYKEKGHIRQALELLLNSLNYSRRIKPNDLAKLYYEIIKLYESLDNTSKTNEYINKCKAIKNTKNSLYKKMCDEMQ